MRVYCTLLYVRALVVGLITAMAWHAGTSFQLTRDGFNILIVMLAILYGLQEIAVQLKRMADNSSEQTRIYPEKCPPSVEVHDGQ